MELVLKKLKKIMKNLSDDRKLHAKIWIRVPKNLS
jgi:hypothetical protein